MRQFLEDGSISDPFSGLGGCARSETGQQPDVCCNLAGNRSAVDTPRSRLGRDGKSSDWMDCGARIDDQATRGGFAV
jgi:hypothetical protein